MGRDKFPTGVFVHEANASWELQFNDDGTCLFFADGVVEATAIYSIANDLYIETTDYAPCRQARIATYYWTVEGPCLTFQAVGKDHCSPRRDRLDGVSWIRKMHASETVLGDQTAQNLEKV